MLHFILWCLLTIADERDLYSVIVSWFCGSDIQMKCGLTTASSTLLSSLKSRCWLGGTFCLEALGKIRSKPICKIVAEFVPFCAQLQTEDGVMKYSVFRTCCSVINGRKIFASKSHVLLNR